MSKKRTTTKKTKKNVNKKSEVINKGITQTTIDYTFQEFPLGNQKANNKEIKIIKKWTKEKAREDSTIDELNAELQVQFQRWNSLSISEKDKILNENIDHFQKDSEKLWAKNIGIILTHRTFFVNQMYIFLKTNEKDFSAHDKKLSNDSLKNIFDVFERYKIFIRDWEKFLNKYKEKIINVFEEKISRNYLAAYINFFTFGGLTILGESFLNVIRTIWLRASVLDELLCDYIPAVLKYTIEQEIIASKDILKISTKSGKMDMLKEIESPEATFRNFNLNPVFSEKWNAKNSKFEIVKEIYEYEDSKDFKKFVDFKIETEETRFFNADFLDKALNRILPITNNPHTRRIIEHYEPKVREKIVFIRNFVLNRRSDIRDVFLNGTENDLKSMSHWFNANTDKSILSGIFLLRDVFKPEDREEIIDCSMNAMIQHNGELLTLNKNELIDWLVFGIIID